MSTVSFVPCPDWECGVCTHLRDVSFGAARGAMGACVVFLVEEITQVLARPRMSAQVVETLSRVDAAFGCLDGLLRAGAPSPPVWKVVPQAALSVREEVTELYDVVSEALRERGGLAVSRQALHAAGVGWGSLHEALCAGAPLPDPWRPH